MFPELTALNELFRNLLTAAGVFGGLIGGVIVAVSMMSRAQNTREEA